MMFVLWVFLLNFFYNNYNLYFEFLLCKKILKNKLYWILIILVNVNDYYLFILYSSCFYVTFYNSFLFYKFIN